MRHLYYRMEGGRVYPCDAHGANSCLMDLSGRKVEHTKLGRTLVSTVFLAIDHNHHDDGPPVLFETMIFGGPLNDYQRRYSTYGEAKVGHFEAVRLAEDALRKLRRERKAKRKQDNPSD